MQIDQVITEPLSSRAGTRAQDKNEQGQLRKQSCWKLS